MAGYNSPFGSGGSTSAILKSAQSTRDKASAYEDQIAAFNWDNSPKTEADFEEYQSYLRGKGETTTDPTKQITYMNKIDSARSAYISNEIQRQSIRVVEGSGTNLDKYNRMVDLFNMAADAGDYDQVQSLRLQLDSLDKTIQSEYKSTIASNKKAETEYNKNIDTQVKDAVEIFQSNVKEVLADYAKLGPRFTEENGTDALGLITAMLYGNPDTGTPGLVDTFNQAQRLTTDPAKMQSYQEQHNAMANGDFKIAKIPGGGELTASDLQEQIQAASTGQTFITTKLDANGEWAIERNQVTGYQYGRDAEGNYKLMPIYGPKVPTDSQFTKDGGNIGVLKTGLGTDANKEVLSYADLLKKNNFDATVRDGRITVVNNGQFNSAGVPEGVPVQLGVDASGNLQFINQGTPYTLNFDEKSGNFTNIMKVTPNPITTLPSGTNQYSRMNMQYFAEQLSKNPNFLNELPGGSIGFIDAATANQLTMEGGPLAKKQAVIQQAQQIQKQQQTIQQQQQAIQKNAGASILSAPANATISLPKPAPLPTITVQKTAPKQTITTQAPAKTNTNISISSGGYSGPSIRF